MILISSFGSRKVEGTRMVALRSPSERTDDSDARQKPDPADWLTLQQAACELNISVTTARRLVRRGGLRNRIVPRRGGFQYLIHIPNSRHAALAGAPCSGGHAAAPPAVERLSIVPPTAGIDHERQIRDLERQVEHLSDALSRALRVKQRALPAGIGDPAADPADPYSRYRWLARKRRWWPF